MSEGRENQPVKTTHSRRNFIKSATAAVAFAALTPKEALAEIAKKDEKTIVFADYIKKLLERGKKIEVKLGKFRVSTSVEKLKTFPSNDIISESLKETPFFQPSQLTQTRMSEEIENPLIFNRNNEDFLAWNSTDQAGMITPVVVALDVENYGLIAEVKEQELEFFDKSHPLFDGTEMTVEGMVETNFNPKHQAELFCKDSTGQHVPVMRSLTQLQQTK